jgi:hypothetical protein
MLVIPLLVLSDARMFSRGGFLVISVILLVYAYIEFFAFRLWVYLYDDRLEIHPALAKLLRDRLGIMVYSPKVVSFRTITALRRTRGFGGFNALVVVRRPPRGQRSEYGISTMGVMDYVELETELLRRVPQDCELYSVDPLGHRGPFR